MKIMQIIIIRHRRENLKKCSLRGLEGREGLSFFRYPCVVKPPIQNSLILDFEGKELSSEDSGKPILLLDATWRHAEGMRKWAIAQPGIEKRSLPPHLRTAYPRRQNDCHEPDRGLASIEALYIVFKILGYNAEGILDHYHWREKFIDENCIND